MASLNLVECDNLTMYFELKSRLAKCSEILQNLRAGGDIDLGPECAALTHEQKIKTYEVMETIMNREVSAYCDGIRVDMLEKTRVSGKAQKRRRK